MSDEEVVLTSADIATVPVAVVESSTVAGDPWANLPDEGALIGGEKVVHDKDEVGNVVGWHKEAGVA